MKRFKMEASEAGPANRRCEHPGCGAEGLYRAPRARDSLHSYIWFCLDHVREYNKSWNYYDGMSTQEVEHHVREDVVGWRPTWPIGVGPLGLGPLGRARRHFTGAQGPRFFDPFGFFEEPEAESTTEKDRQPVWPEKSREGKALALFNLRPPYSLAAIKARYKELVKRHHPDVHGGDKGAEEKLKLINEAYGILKRIFA